MGGWIDEQMDEWMNGWMDGLMDGWMIFCQKLNDAYSGKRQEEVGENRNCKEQEER